MSAAVMHAEKAYGAGCIVGKLAGINTFSKRIVYDS